MQRLLPAAPSNTLAPNRPARAAARRGQPRKAGVSLPRTEHRKASPYPSRNGRLGLNVSGRFLYFFHWRAATVLPGRLVFSLTS